MSRMCGSSRRSPATPRSAGIASACARSSATGARHANLWTVVDATADRQRQENVFQELQHAIDFLDHAPAGFFSAGPDGAISYMNKTLAGWLGYDLTQVGSGGVSLADIVANNGSTLLTAITGGSGEVRTAQIDLDLKRRNGRSLPVRLLHRVAFGQDGAPGASRTLVLNRTAGEEPEEDLRAAEVRFARFFNSTPMAIAAVDPDGKVHALQRSLRQTAAAGDEGRQPPPGPCWPASSSATAPPSRAPSPPRSTIAATFRRSTPRCEEEDGLPTRSARFFVAPSEDAGKKGATIYALDTTEHRKLQEGFAQSQKMQAVGQLAGGVAHDFNNMLTAIIGYSDLLLANHRPTDPSFQDIIQIKQTANRAAGLTRQLLAFSRRQTLRPQVLQLGDVLTELQLLLRRLVGEKVEVDLKHGRDLWFVKADINQFEQVVINLVVNARDAMPESGGRIQLRTRNVAAGECAAFGEASLTPAEYVLIEVEDNGAGIAPDVMAKIFEPFFTTKEVGKGTGLGLSMVFGIVKQSGGFVFPASEVGRGTVFRIFLPRHVPEAGEIARQARGRQARGRLHGAGDDLAGRGRGRRPRLCGAGAGLARL